MVIERERNPFFDVVKATAIFLVVLSHAFPKSNVPFPMWVGNLIVAVNMPIFFIVSGYFCWKTIENGDWTRMLRHVRSYFLPALWIAFLQAFLTPIFVGLGKGPVDWAYMACKWFIFGPWFIWCLADLYIVSFALGMLRAKFPVFNMGLLVAFAWVGLLFWPECKGIVYKQYASEMLPYFLFGGLCWSCNWRPWQNRRLGLCCTGALLLYLVTLSVPCRDVGLSFYFNETTWRAFCGFKTTVCLLARLALGVVGSIGVMWICYEICRVKKIVESKPLHLISSVGECTLGIYLMHQWVLLRVIELCPVAVSTRFHTLVLTLLLCFFCFTVTWLTQQRITLTRLWVWGKQRRRS